MKTYFSLRGLNPDLFRNPVLTIGTFDGVHAGHREVLALLRERAGAASGESVVLTFETHPRQVLSGVRPNPITSLHHRLRLIAETGVDTCIVLRFNRTLSRMTAREFLRLLKEKVGLSEFVAGPDTTFGAGCEGNVAFLRNVSGEFGFKVTAAEAVTQGGAPISSSRIREFILAGDMDEVGRMLGRRFSLFGTVVRGQGRGRRLGTPTANLDLRGEVVPPPGIYATTFVWAGRDLPSVTSIGRRPTFGDNLPVTVETYVLDFDEDLYGADVEVVFVQKLRDEMRFPSEGELVAAIGRDIETARSILLQPAAPVE
jgi:riboflavin kinase/FMN adenylyltransferase